MLISAKIIKKPRARRQCELCQRRIVGETLRLYGSAHREDPPYVMYIHPDCTMSEDVKAKLKKVDKYAK